MGSAHIPDQEARVSVTTLLPGVRPHGARFQVRVRPFPSETFATADLANARALELRRFRESGVRDLARLRPPEWLTLGEVADRLFARKQVSGRRRPLSPAGLAHWRLSLQPWREGRFAAVPVRALRPLDVEDYLLARAAEHPTTARNELQALKATLQHAAALGEPVPPGLLAIEPIAVQPRRGRGLTFEQLELVCSLAPGYAWRLLRLAGTAGFRIGELFTLTDDRVDLAARSIFIPAELCKELREKTVPLFDDEVQLVREQLLARAAGTTLVFPTKTGKPWRYGHFHKLAWAKARLAAEQAWAREHPREPNPFPGLKLHDLRRTAVNLMREQRMSPELAAARVGHADGGALLLRTYRHVEQEALRAEMDRIGSLAATADDAESPPPTSVTPPAVGTLHARSRGQ
jgi:integrase